MKLKYKISKMVYSVLTFIVLLCTFAFNIFAESPSLFSAGFSYDGDYIYSGNTDVLITLGVSGIDSDDYIDLSTSLNPSISFDMTTSLNSFSQTSDFISAGSLGPTSISNRFSNFESSDNYFVSGIASDNSYFSSQFDINYSNDYYGVYFVDYVKVTARDFYIYLDPNFEVTDPYYDDLYAESFIYLNSNLFFNGAEGSIYYCLAGEEDSANNRQVYNYSYGYDYTSDFAISTLPTDQSFSGLYSEPTLIYVEYFELYLPLDSPDNYDLNGFHLSGTYLNYNMDYRNIDISSYEEPISPINPGVFRDYTSWLGTAVGGFLDLQIVDGFSLGGILMVLIAFMITLWFLKVFAGG